MHVDLASFTKLEAAMPTPPPYFDTVFRWLDERHHDGELAFGRHVHWGYWEQPETATGSVEDFAAAADQLSRLVYEAAGVSNGQRVLDVGCGFGGTIASINERFHGMQLVGVNIDPRQLERADQIVQPKNGNQIQWLEAPAEELPLDDDDFDAVLAVECAFHFDRRRFFAEVQRVLRCNGQFALSDFIPGSCCSWLLRTFWSSAKGLLRHTCGPMDFLYSVQRYRRLGNANGLRLTHECDITRNTLPTYPIVRQLLADEPNDESQLGKGSRWLERLSRWRLVRYQVLAFEQTHGNATESEGRS